MAQNNTGSYVKPLPSPPFYCPRFNHKRRNCAQAATEPLLYSVECIAPHIPSIDDVWASLSRKSPGDKKSGYHIRDECPQWETVYKGVTNINIRKRESEDGAWRRHEKREYHIVSPRVWRKKV